MITLDQAEKMIQKYLSSKTQLHCREVAVIMHAIAQELKQEEKKWTLTGLIHDLDYESVNENWKQHGVKIQEMIGQDALPDDVWQAIQAHNCEYTNCEPKTDLDYALMAADNISGLIYATALIYPDKKIASVKPKSIRKRMKETAFARNVNREAIRNIEKTGMTLDRFIEIALEAMKEIADEIGL